MVHREVGQHLAVESDLLFGEPADEFRIGQSVGPCAGVDTLDPQAAESPLFVFAIAVCILQTLLDCVFGNSPNVSPRAEVTFKTFFRLALDATAFTERGIVF